MGVRLLLVVPHKMLFGLPIAFPKALFFPSPGARERVYVHKHQYILGPTLNHFSSSRQVRVKMSAERVQKYIHTQECKLYYYYYQFGGHWENKNWKKWQQNRPKNISFTKTKKMAPSTVMVSRFWLAAYIVRLFDSHFSLVHVSGLKYILACQILHFSQ